MYAVLPPRFPGLHREAPSTVLRLPVHTRGGGYIQNPGSVHHPWAAGELRTGESRGPRRLQREQEPHAQGPAAQGKAALQSLAESEAEKGHGQLCVLELPSCVP